MFKKLAIVVPMAFLAMASTAAFAAEQASHSIDLKAHVPTNSFYVLPVNAEIISAEQVIVYDLPSMKFKPFVESFDAKHTAGSINASVDMATANLYNGNTKIDLGVEFNGVKLNGTGQEVISAVNAKAGTRVDLKITPAAATAPTGYAPGDYTGTVALTFDAVVAAK